MTHPRPPFAPHETATRLYGLVATACAQSQVKAAVEANHDDNRWWPVRVGDWRVRMLVAGWSTRVSYAMIDTYAEVVKVADTQGWDDLNSMDEADLTDLVRPLGLTRARIRYLRSLQGFLAKEAVLGTHPFTTPAAEYIAAFADGVDGASFKIAQCAALYSRGYHCGIIPVDSGMITRLVPLLGIEVGSGPQAHEHMRVLLESCAAIDTNRYRSLITDQGYRVTIPAQAAPTWWLHLVLIYFKRLFLNHPPSSRLCSRRPVCPAILDCVHSPGA